ncbi:hypothetical protein FB451DRAFT_1196275 [Mycena latifolia]|nr:hypothetical protein FB451DRAFT_1196275 [Mycena latifolia]
MEGSFRTARGDRHAAIPRRQTTWGEELTHRISIALASCHHLSDDSPRVQHRATARRRGTASIQTFQEGGEGVCVGGVGVEEVVVRKKEVLQQWPTELQNVGAPPTCRSRHALLSNAIEASSDNAISQNSGENPRLSSSDKNSVHFLISLPPQFTQNIEVSSDVNVPRIPVSISSGLSSVTVALALVVQVASRPLYEITIRHSCDSAEAPALDSTDSDFAISFAADDQTSPLGGEGRGDARQNSYLYATLLERLPKMVAQNSPNPLKLSARLTALQEDEVRNLSGSGRKVQGAKAVEWGKGHGRS